MCKKYKMAPKLLLPLSLLFLLTSNGMSLPFESIEKDLKSGPMMEMLRAMVNQTKGDTLNLPANASSIRENITDTFSCENRTYGYYADVDNECQIFHVCLPSQAASGRNTTYRWSFICPNETIFNQEVLTCTRPRDSIDCEDSPMYYDRNNDIGKVNNTEAEGQPQNTNSSIKINIKNNIIKNKRKDSVHRKQNLAVQSIVDEEIENKPSKPVAEGVKFNEYAVNYTEIIDMNKEEVSPVMEVVTGESTEVEIPTDAENQMMENERLIGERSLKRKERRLRRRGSFRFKADV